MLNFIPWVLLVLQKKESSDLGIGGTLPGLCQVNICEAQQIHIIKLNLVHKMYT